MSKIEHGSAASKGGIHFSNPYHLRPVCHPSTNYNIIDSGAAGRTAATTNFHTEMARRGIQDTTNWTAGTYKPILNVTSGGCLLAAYIGCTAGGAETHTVRITVDGVEYVITIAGLASGERGALLATGVEALSADYVTASAFIDPGAEALDADKATWGSLSLVTAIRPWRVMGGIPLLEAKRTLLLEAKHSVDITNSTATAYSSVMYRQLLAA